MAKITCGEQSYTVNHAVKGADYVHGYDAEGNLVVSFEGVTNFSGITYDGTYMAPEACVDEPCNQLYHVNGKLVKRDGTVVASTEPLTATYEDGTVETIEVYVK